MSPSPRPRRCLWARPAQASLSSMCSPSLPHGGTRARTCRYSQEHSARTHNARRHASARAHTKHGKHIRPPTLAHLALACASAAHSRPCCAFCAPHVLYVACYILHVARCWTACVIRAWSGGRRPYGRGWHCACRCAPVRHVTVIPIRVATACRLLCAVLVCCLLPLASCLVLFVPLHAVLVCWPCRATGPA